MTTKDTVWEGITVPHIHQATIWTVYLALLVSWTVMYVRSNMPADWHGVSTYFLNTCQHKSGVISKKI